MQRWNRLRAALFAGLLTLLLGNGAGQALAQDSAIAIATPNEERLYALSPDGSMVAAVPRNSRSLCIYTVPEVDLVTCVDLDASEVRIDPFSISWSPANDAIVFSEPSTLMLIDSDIMHLDIATGELTYLTDDGIAARLPLTNDDPHDPYLVDIMPAWSPDGSTIAFSRTTWSPSDSSTSALMLLDVATNEVTELALFDDDAGFALPYRTIWAPDGASAITSSWFIDAERDKVGVWQFQTATGEFSQLAGPDREEVQFASPQVVAVSPTGDQLVLSYPEYMATVFEPNRHSGYALLDLMDGTTTFLEPSDAFGGGDALVIAPNFSPDGTSLVFGVNRQNQSAGIVVARDLETGEDTVLAELPAGDVPVTYDFSFPVQVGGNSVLVNARSELGFLIPLPATSAAATPEPDDSAAATPVIATPEVEGVPATILTADASATLRDAADSDATIVAILPPGTELVPLGQSIESDGHTWLEVTVIDTGERGFIRTDFLEPAS